MRGGHNKPAKAQLANGSVLDFESEEAEDAFFTSLHNHNRKGRSHADGQLAWKNAVEIATKDGDLKPLENLLIQQYPMSDETAVGVAEWIVRCERPAHPMRGDDRDDSRPSDWTAADEDEYEERMAKDRFVEALAAASFEDRQRMLGNIVEQCRCQGAAEKGAAQTKSGRTAISKRTDRLKVAIQDAVEKIKSTHERARSIEFAGLIRPLVLRNLDVVEAVEGSEWPTASTIKDWLIELDEGPT